MSVLLYTVLFCCLLGMGLPKLCVCTENATNGHVGITSTQHCTPTRKVRHFDRVMFIAPSGQKVRQPTCTGSGKRYCKHSGAERSTTSSGALSTSGALLWQKTGVCNMPPSRHSDALQPACCGRLSPAGEMQPGDATIAVRSSAEH